VTDLVDEQQLLRQAQQGDYDAFAQLHAALEPSINRFVNRLVGGRIQEAEDIVQDTFIALYLNLNKIDPVENLRPYVFRIARNNCYDILRRQGRYEHLPFDEEPVNVRVSFDLAQTTGNVPEDTTHWLLLHLEVQEAMEYLPEAQRQALILYSEQDMSYGEIAEIMDVEVGTIKSRIFHARRSLRRMMKPETLAAIEGRVLPIDTKESKDDEAEAENPEPDPEPIEQDITEERSMVYAL
jgi:RNA polymerase sigma-70 factor, ECF subfamily